MQDQNQSRIVQIIQRRPAIVLIIIPLAILLFFAFGQIYRYESTGLLIIKTNNKNNSISISPASETSGQKTGNGNMNVRLSSGSYIVQVDSKTATSKRIVTVIARKTNIYTINLRQPTTPVDVLSQGGSSIIADSNTMYYIDIQSHILYKLTNSGLPSEVTNIWLDHIEWQNINYGIGTGIGNKTLYQVADGSVSRLNSPFSLNNNIIFGLSNNGLLAVSDGNTVYIKKSSNSSFSNIFTASSNQKITSLTVGSKDILLITKPRTSSGNANTAKLTIIDINGHKISSGNMSVYASSWSPDGTKLAITSDGNTKIYNNQFKLITTLPDINVIGLTWYNSDTVLYSANNLLTEYNLTTDTSTQLASSTQSDQISGLFPDKKDGRLYILTTTVSGGYQLLKINMSTNPPKEPSYYYTLGIIFPETTQQCSFGYSNFVKPVVIVNSWKSKSNCTTSLSQIFSEYNLPSLPVIFNPSGNLG